ncbi:MAG TPA: 3-oxoacyl-ACP reductase family protein [Chthonomonadaceae bacterium]|nr:3-oxoacyl-ACP reductase family protein [Chthonomonadaceae bacterium]
MGKLSGKVALVTGAGRGLGRAYALRLASLGADVVINDLHLDSAQEFDEELTAESVMAECEALGVRALGIEADVTDKQAVDRMFAQALETFGRMDVIVNNAGGALRPVDRSYASIVPEDDWRFILDLNLNATVYCCQAAAVPMKAQGSGKIINVASQAGLRGNLLGQNAPYCTAKAGVCEYTRVLAGELGPHNINVNCIAPGMVLTSRANKQFNRNSPDQVARYTAMIALRRMGTTEDCARVVEFLATDLSDYITGQVIAVCGGMVLSPS